MSRVSRNKLDSKIYAAILEQLDTSIASLTKAREIADLFDSLFTKTERLMLAKRLAIAILLERGVTYPKISKTLKVSSVTISFVRNGILKQNEDYSALIKLLNQKLSTLNI